MRQEAIRQLRCLGYQVDEDTKYVRPPGFAVTDPPLLPPPELDYPHERVPLSQDGDANDESVETDRA